MEFDRGALVRNRGPTSFDELERAVGDMRERFLSIGEHIAGLLHSLTLQIDSAPRATRASISSAAEQIARTQQQLRLQMANLPANPEERYQLMRSLLQAQGGALQQLSIIVQQQTPQPIAPFAPSGGAGPGDLFPADTGYDWTTAPRGAAMAGHALADEHFDYLMHEGAPGRRPTQPQARLAHPAQPRPNRPAKTRPARRKSATAMAIVSSRLLAVVGLMLVAAVLAYLYFPLADDQRARGGSRSMATAAADRKTTREPAALPDVPAGTAARPRFIARLPAEEPAGETTAAAGSTLPARIERLAERGADEPTASTTALPPWTGAPRPRTPAPDAELAASAAKPSAAAESAATPAEASPPRFVAVVFTHRDQAVALDAFTDLRQRYPALLARRKAEAQPVEVADKGTWHRLVVLPAGSRQTATGLCDRLQAAGYDRCWVKTY
jgi:SPOR domain